MDRLAPENDPAFASAFASPYYELRVLAGELSGKRRNEWVIEPMQALLSIPIARIDRPDDALRRRVAAALADVGAAKTLALFTELLSDPDPFVAEQGARGLVSDKADEDDARAEAFRALRRLQRRAARIEKGHTA